MDYPLQLAAQLQQLLKSLRKSRQLTQAALAQRLGVVQSRVADIERDPGAVSVAQLLEVLAMLGAQLVVRDTQPLPSAAPHPAPNAVHEALPQAFADRHAAQPAARSAGSTARAKAKATTTSTPTPNPAMPPGDDPTPDMPRGQW